MKRFRVQFEIDVPEDTSKEQAEEWVRYCVGDTGSIEGDNPLIERSFDPIFNTFELVQK